jgi:hypothetical protein
MFQTPMLHQGIAGLPASLFQAVCFCDGQPGIVSCSWNILHGIPEQHDLTLVGSQQFIARFAVHGKGYLSYAPL